MIKKIRRKINEFFKKLGEILAVGSATIVGVGPLVAPLFGNKGEKILSGIATVANDLTAIGQIVLQIEVALQGKSGPDKLAAAINLVGPIIRTSQLVSGKKIADEALLQKGISEVTQGIVDVLNSIHQESVTKEVKT